MAKILIIEDDQSLSDLYTTVLKMQGHHVLQTQNGSEGYEKIASYGAKDILLKYKITLIDLLASVKYNLKTGGGIKNSD